MLKWWTLPSKSPRHPNTCWEGCHSFGRKIYLCKMPNLGRYLPGCLGEGWHWNLVEIHPIHPKVGTNTNDTTIKVLVILLYITTWKYQLFCIGISLVLRIKTKNLAVSFVANFRGNSRNGNWIIGRIPTSIKLYTWTFQRVPNGSNGSWRVSNHHPLGSNWHPLEGAGTWLFWNDVFFKVESLCLQFSNHVEFTCFFGGKYRLPDYPPWN